MFYEYQCKSCGGWYETQTFTRVGESLSSRLCECGGNLIRAVSVPNTTPIGTLQTHYNHTVGDYVTGTRDFEQKLKVGQQRMSERLGYDQVFTPVSPSEAVAHGERTASNDGKSGESVDYYARMRNQVNTKRTIFT